MTDKRYDVDTDMGDDPEASEIAQVERRVEPEHDIQGYEFEDDDTGGGRGIDEAVRDERSDVLPKDNWGGETESTEEQAMRVVDDGATEDTGEGAAVRDGRFETPESGPVRDEFSPATRHGRPDRTRDQGGYVPDADDPADPHEPDR
ncbi:hypothetical protein [Nocardiopsis sp. JB363]|uniref:hypothetical protein n=1 Tax=Nocardiopsis sp. JB363 TaxID=1434837 RepID=UPI000B35A086|nr:hypothetical protein [Nocardiopsis sp. JB363]